MLFEFIIRTPEYRHVNLGLDSASTIILGLTALGVVFLVTTLARNPAKVCKRLRRL